MATKKGRQRVRLAKGPPEQSVKAMREGRKRSLKEAPRRENGKIVQGFKYKSLLEGYREMGREPTIIDGRTSTRDPLFVLQPNLGKRIVKLIRKGYPYTTVCRYCGITPKTFRDWLEKGKAGVSKDYIRFYKKIARAEARAEMRTLERLKLHDRSDWRVSAWQLERRWPEHWSKKDRIIAETHVNATIATESKDDLSKSVIKDQAARELARRLIAGDDLLTYDPLPETDTVEEDA